MVAICWRMCAPRSPSTAAHTPSKFGNANARLGIADTGMRFASGEPTVKKSSAPERTWLSISVEPPSWLLGKIWISTRPLVAARIASQASAARLLIGCPAGRSLPYFRLKSAACARPTSTAAPATAPASIVRLEIVPMTSPPRFLVVSWGATLVGQHRGGKFLGDHDRGQVGVAAWDGRHDRCVGDAQAYNAVEAALW